MDLIKTPVKGMPEYLPNEMILREKVINIIKKTFIKYGFMEIKTPIVEHIENLTSKQGGENEQLIFKILKRGEKLVENISTESMCDYGLRYDLTLPLARYYSNNAEKLPNPFKSLQIGDAFRADRPQKGRFREFTQCDIDIIGDSSYIAEIELITATIEALKELGLTGLKVRINDRNILRGMALSCGFTQDMLSSIFIILDKFDKIGLDGVKEQLKKLELPENAINTYCKYFVNENNKDLIEFLNKDIENFIEKDCIQNLKTIIEILNENIGNNCEIVFDPTLVRGMSYYTGTIFEIETTAYKLSVAGGGRYDKLIGKFFSNIIPACGFSIGFERIMSIIIENNLLKCEDEKQTVVLLSKDLTDKRIKEIIKKVNDLRKQGQSVSMIQRNANAKFQKEKLKQFGFHNIIEIFNDKGEL